MSSQGPNFNDIDDLTDEQIAEFKEAFQIFDKDSDGCITLQELGTALRSLGQNPSEEELSEFFESLDLDQNGSIGFKEFLVLMAKKVKENNDEAEIINAFRTFDIDGNGKISVDELRLVLMSAPEFKDDSEIQDLLEQADIDGNGTIDYYEFVKLVNSLCV